MENIIKDKLDNIEKLQKEIKELIIENSLEYTKINNEIKEVINKWKQLC